MTAAARDVQAKIIPSSDPYPDSFTDRQPDDQYRCGDLLIQNHWLCHSADVDDIFNEIPGMLGSSVAGVWVDRLDRGKEMLFADLGQAAGSVLLILSFLSGSFQIWQLYLIVFIQGIIAIFQGPAENAAVTVLVPESQRERANALREIAFPSILQQKTPPDMQGRVFSIVSQLAFLGSTASFLITGYLVDKILKPAAARPVFSWLKSLLNGQPAFEMTLVLVCTGVIMFLATLWMAAWPRVRRLEEYLPDYPAVQEDE